MENAMQVEYVDLLSIVSVFYTCAFLNIPFDLDLFSELNLERYELSKSGKLLFNHPQRTHDDRFLGLRLAIYTSKKPSAFQNSHWYSEILFSVSKL